MAANYIFWYAMLANAAPSSECKYDKINIMYNFERLADEYVKLETYRKYRNKWVAGGVGGVAIGGAIAVSTGNFSIGILVALGSALGAESMVLDANSAVCGTRNRISSIIRYAREDIPQTEVQVVMTTLQSQPNDSV